MKKLANESISINISSKCCADDEVELWIDALEELKRCGVDNAAKETSFESCRYCKFPCTKKRLDPNEFDEIRGLNSWEPFSKVLSQRAAKVWRDTSEARRLRLAQKNKDVKPTSQSKMKKMISKRDNYTYAPRALSLLGIDVEEFRRLSPSEQLKTIKKKQEELQIGPLTYDASENCEQKLKMEIERIQNGEFTPEERSVLIKNLLDHLESNKCFRRGKQGHCACLVRKLDIPALREAAFLSAFIKCMIMDNVNEALDQKYASRLGIARKRVEVGVQSVDVYDFQNQAREKKSFCCRDLSCTCGKKKFNN